MNSATNDAIIEISDIHKIYPIPGGKQSPALSGVSFTIRRGEFVAIMGPSGSGKSTLMNLLGTLDVPTTGRYLLNGTDVATLDDDELSHVRGQALGFVFQQYNLLPRCTVLHNLLLPVRYAGLYGEHSLERARELLERVGLEEFGERRPTTLSGGQQQRVAIARALMNRPALLLADEPTGNLDTAASLYVMELLADIHADGQTIVLVTHEPDIAQYADRLIEVKDGRIARDMPVDKIRWDD